MMPSPRCPVCSKPVQADHTPFCSPGCRDRDLLAWLSEDYRLPVRADDLGGDPDRLDSIEERD